MYVYITFLNNLFYYFCRSRQAAQYLAEAFRQNKVKKTYWAIAIGAPKYDEGDICIPLKEDVVNKRYKIVLNKGEDKEGKSVSLF